MNEAARVAFINSQVACMLAEMEGMRADNAYRISRDGLDPVYGEEAFDGLADRFGLGHNAVVAFLTGGD